MFFRSTPEEIGKQSRFEFIENKAAEGEVALYCRVLDVSPQGYKKYIEASKRPYKYAELLANMQAILDEDIFNKTYGKRRMYEKLQLDYECEHCYNTVAEVMRENGLLQKKNKSSTKGLTKSDKEAQKSEDLIKRDFSAEAPNKKVVTDITEYSARDGKLYVSAIFDCYDNACIGLTIADNMKAEMVVDTYEQASQKYELSGVISHSDRGSQYTSTIYRETIGKLNIIQSMNSASGRCLDNAKGESMWGCSKVEIMSCCDTKKMTCYELAIVIYDYYQYWNHRRICSAIGGVPPIVKRGAYYAKLYDLTA